MRHEHLVRIAGSRTSTPLIWLSFFRRVDFPLAILPSTAIYVEETHLRALKILLVPLWVEANPEFSATVGLVDLLLIFNEMVGSNHFFKL